MTHSEDVINRLEAALISLDRFSANAILEETEGVWSSLEQLKYIVVPALERIGKGWETGRIALTQVYMAGRICEELVEKILPGEAPDRKRQPRMAITVLQDYHLLGKRIVLSALRASGYELKDHGRMEALAKVKTLSGLLPICASCKKIRDDQGYWNRIEAYIGKHSDAQFSHGICPDCAKKLYPDLFEKEGAEGILFKK